MALEFIDRHIKAGTPIDKKLISEFHKLTVQELNPSDEGDYTPGQYRTTEVSIKNSLHKPPLAVKVPEYMDELIAFINEARPQKLKLLAIAITHHRFAWIHPFRNGNGRTIRLLTYAMLISQGFAVNHILNPTAVFCNDRSQYYKMLAKADKGSGAGLLEWCTYVLQNLLEEIKKIDRLLDYDYLIQTILFPALAHALERKNINSEEYQILKLAVEKGVIMAKDVNQILRKKYPTLVSAVINKLKKEELLTTLPDKQRSYFVSFINNHLLRAVIEQLRKESFITSSLG
jgi:Fic family protein